MSCIKKLLFSALLAPLLSGQGTRAAEFEVLDRFSVDGYTVLKSSADIPGGSLTVGGSAFVVKSGSVGIGTTAPAAALDVKGAINVLNPGVGVSVGSLNTNTGILGVTFGYGNSVDAANGVAMGKSNTASGGNNAAIGFSNSAGTGFASAFGYNNNAGAWNSNAFGYSNTASSSGASAFGNNVNNSIANSLMIGPSNTAKITILSTGLVGIGTTVPRGRIESLASNNSSTYDSAAYTGGGMGNPGWGYQFSQTLGSGGGGDTFKGGDAGGIFFGGAGSYVAGGGVGVYAAGGGTGNYGYGGAGIYAVGGSNGALVGGVAPAGVFMGNVGIGMTAPSELLHLYKAGGAYLKMNATNDGSLWESGIKTRFVDGEGSYMDLGYYRNSATFTPAVTISGGASDTGNVGIGTTAPSAKLHVLGTSGTANITGDTLAIDGIIMGPNYAFNTGANPVNLSVQANSAFAAEAGGTIGLGGRYTGAQYANWAILKGAKENATDGNIASYLAFGTRANGAQITEKMRINSSGNVGIGTTNPVAKLDVGGTDSIKIPAGTAGQRPVSSATAGMMRFNTDSGKFELYNGIKWKSVTAYSNDVCTGGDVSTILVSGIVYSVHTFVSAGTFSCTEATTVEVFVVAGGGGGGLPGNVPGGGGGGGVVYNTAYAVSAPVSVTIGAGGAAGVNGSDSTFGTITAYGGGKGGGESTNNAGSGGSGGGGAYGYSGGAGTQGYAGGTGGSAGGAYPAGGGGGAGGVGENGVNGARGGNGGPGRSIHGSAYYGGGGGGGSWTGSTSVSYGGIGGGGNGSANIAGFTVVATNGAPNTGGGGGGGYTTTESKAGGSGIVIVRVPL